VASRLERARTLYGEEKLDQARKIFKKLSDRDVYDAATAEEATFYLGECHYQQRNYVDAYRTYRTLLEKHRSNRYFETAVRRQFFIGAAYCNGQISNFWKKKGFGARILKEALKYQPFGEFSAQAMLILGNYYFDKGNYDDALIRYELLIREYGNSPEVNPARYRKALCLYNTLQGNRYDSGELGEAIESLEDAEELVSHQAKSKTATRQLSDIRRKLNDLREAGAKENYDVARFYLKNGKPRAAATYFHEILEEAPHSHYAELARKALDGIAEEITR